MKKILLINGHPNPESFCFALAKAYKDGAQKSGALLKEIVIAELDFNPNLKHGYQKRTDLEPDLLEAWEKIKWADHLVWVHPVWWGGFPAIMKGFVDRLFLPGMAFRYRADSVWWDKLLTGKTAHIITTLDQPSLYYRWVYGRPSVNQLRKTILQYCGVDPVRVSYIQFVKKSDEQQRKKWLAQIHHLGEKQR
jgi:NAD(P)H dehydrogenase (quinone)